MSHAVLRPSGSHMWLNCPGSLYLQGNRKVGIAAQEGRKAHELAYFMLKGLYWDILEYPLEMVDYITGYVDFVNKVQADTKYYEQKVDILPSCFGTADVVAISWNKISIIDLKYGANVEVDINNNEQLLLYAWGAYRTLWDGDTDPHLIQITIYQPRVTRVIKSQTLTFAKLYQFIEYVKPKAKAALAGSRVRKEGDWCMFCKIKYTCGRGVKCAWE